MSRRTSMLSALWSLVAAPLAASLVALGLGPPVAGPIVLAVAVLALDLVDRWRSGRRLNPSVDAAIVATAILAAPALCAFERASVGQMLPLLVSLSAVPLLRGGGAANRCARSREIRS